MSFWGESELGKLSYGVGCSSRLGFKQHVFKQHPSREGVSRVCLLEGLMPGQVTQGSFLLTRPGSTPVSTPETFAGTGLPEPVCSCPHSAFLVTC